MRAVAIILVTIIVGCRDAAVVSTDGGAYCNWEHADNDGNKDGCGNAVDVIRCKP